MTKLGMMKILTCHTQRCTQILKCYRPRSDQLFQRSHKVLKIGSLTSFNLKFMELNKSLLTLDRVPNTHASIKCNFCEAMRSLHTYYTAQISTAYYVY